MSSLGLNQVFISFVCCKSKTPFPLVGNGGKYKKTPPLCATTFVHGLLGFILVVKSVHRVRPPGTKYDACTPMQKKIRSPHTVPHFYNFAKHLIKLTAPAG